jgi:hypothetical protein
MLGAVPALGAHTRAVLDEIEAEPLGGTHLNKAVPS